MRFFIAVLLSLLAFHAQAQEPPSSFAAAKKYLADLHEEIGYQFTLYCGCPYARTTRSGGVVDWEACGLEARKNKKRFSGMEWEHAAPASWTGKVRACWALKGKAYPECEGKSGRKCCEDVNPGFDLAHNDPNNLFPSSGEINGDRSNHPFGEVDGEPRLYGSCNFEIGKTDGIKVAEPPEGRVRGVLARAMLYMSMRYGVNIKMPLETVWKWHIENPPEQWEITRAQRIADDTGLRNRWILGPAE